MDLSPSNYRLLSWLVDRFNLSDVAHVYEVGASNASARGRVRSDKIVGAEDLSIGTASGWHATKEVPIVRVDDFLVERNISNAYHVSVDAEGWDSLVLEGMARTLRRRAIAILEFEYSGAGYWSAHHKGARTLEEKLAWLNAMGYSCYWQARHDLIPATRPCWLPSFETRSWSNLVCAHEPGALEVLDGIAEEGARRRGRMCYGTRRMSRSYRRAWCGSPTVRGRSEGRDPPPTPSER
jgi:FkbM family methyltransferase